MDGYRALFLAGLVFLPACRRTGLATRPAPPPAALSLLRPAAEAVLPQNQAEIGCPFAARRGYGTRTRFQGEPVAGAGGYYLVVQRIGSSLPWIDIRTDEPFYEKQACGSFVVDRNLEGRQWRVEAVTPEGRILIAGETRTFRRAPCRLAGGAACSS